MTEKSYMDKFKLIGFIGGALATFSGFGINTYNAIKKASEMKDNKNKQLVNAEKKSEGTSSES